MSIRPNRGAPNPARGGDGRRRRWSESPVPRPGVRRVRAAGVPPVPASYNSGRGISTTSTAPNLVPISGLTDGDLLVTWMAVGGTGVTPTPPTGWTTLVSDAVGAMGYLVCYATYTSGLAQTATNAAGNPVIGRTFGFTAAGSLAPVITAGPNETLAASTVGVPVASGMNAWQVAGLINSTAYGWSNETNGEYVTIGTMGNGIDSGYLGSSTSEPTGPYATGAGPVASPGSPTTYFGCSLGVSDFVTIALALA